jgi:hypothetical protein
MGRTVPSFRNVLAEEKQEWKPYRNALDKSEKKAFDEMWDIPRLYTMACSGSVSLVPFHPIAISILFHHYKDLMQCRKQVEQLLLENNNSAGGSSRTTIVHIKEEEKDLQNEIKIAATKK